MPSDIRNKVYRLILVTCMQVQAMRIQENVHGRCVRYGRPEPYEAGSFDEHQRIYVIFLPENVRLRLFRAKSAEKSIAGTWWWGLFLGFRQRYLRLVCSMHRMK